MFKIHTTSLNEGRHLSRVVPGARIISGWLGGSTPRRPTEMRD